LPQNLTAVTLSTYTVSQKRARFNLLQLGQNLTTKFFHC